MSLQAKPKPNQPPRPFVIRVHYFHIHELILRQERQLKSISSNGRPIHIFPDLTAAEAKRRAAFGDVKKRLREIEGARFGFRLPVKFHITLPGAKERMFSAPSWRWTKVSLHVRVMLTRVRRQTDIFTGL